MIEEACERGDLPMEDCLAGHGEYIRASSTSETESCWTLQTPSSMRVNQRWEPYRARIGPPIDWTKHLRHHSGPPTIQLNPPLILDNFTNDPYYGFSYHPHIWPRLLPPPAAWTPQSSRIPPSRARPPTGSVLEVIPDSLLNAPIATLRLTLLLFHAV